MPSPWSHICDFLQKTIDSVDFSRWIKPVQAEFLDRGILVLRPPSRYHCEWFREHYLDLILSYCRQIDHNLHIKIETPACRNRSKDHSISLTKTLSRVPDLDSSKSFDTLLVGSFNRFAFNAAKSFSEKPVMSFNPLLIEGAQGSGKTHFLQAIANRYSSRNQQIPLLLDCRHFGAQDVALLRFLHENSNYCSKTVSILLIDNMHLLPKRDKLQQHLCHLFDYFYDLPKPMVFTSDGLPGLLPSLEPALRSRLNWGLVARINELTFEDSMRILAKLCNGLNASQSKSIRAFVQLYRPKCFADILGCVEKLKLFIQNGGISINRQLLDQTRGEEEAILLIQGLICKVYHLQPQDLCGTSRQVAVSNARHMCMYFCKNMTSLSYAKIGSYFGSRNHSTIIHACRKVRAEIKRNPEFAQEVVKLERDIYKLLKRKNLIKKEG
ncbi:MAG: hypothetical protein JRJ12_07560 [Deltaproteobacteria bacterium]|nr:hypothetical protein [Deltaproteobacteria bacterium]MBW2071364.1 hypothetical protein [Deltaproteobacteria bacterium]